MSEKTDDSRYIVYAADLSMGYKPNYFPTLKKMNDFINDSIRAGKIVTVKTVENE